MRNYISDNSVVDETNVGLNGASVLLPGAFLVSEDIKVVAAADDGSTR
jgi:hypothetical protein